MAEAAFGAAIVALIFVRDGEVHEAVDVRGGDVNAAFVEGDGFVFFAHEVEVKAELEESFGADGIGGDGFAQFGDGDDAVVLSFGLLGGIEVLGGGGGVAASVFGITNDDIERIVRHEGQTPRVGGRGTSGL